jgi:hypothetical protein
MGSFEESARAIAIWLKSRNYQAKRIEVERFFNNLPFRINTEVGMFALYIASGKAKFGTLVKKDDCVLLWNNGYHVLYGKILKQSVIGKSGVFSLYDAVGRDVGAETSVETESGKTNIFLHEKYLFNDARITQEGLVEEAKENMPQELYDRTKKLIERKSLDMSELASFISGKKRKEEILQISMMVWRILAARLRRRKRELKGDGINKAVKENRQSVLTHELAHAELIGRIPVGEQEVFAFLSQLGYGLRKRSALADVIVASSQKEIDFHILSAKVVLEELSKDGLGFEEIAKGPSEKEIENAARKVLDRLSHERFGKSFDQVVDVSLFKQAEKFAESVDK